MIGMLRRFALRSARILGRAEGAQIFEFALALPILLVVVAGIVDFGGAWNLKQKLANAAREGARIAAGEPKPAGLDSSSCNGAGSVPCQIKVVADTVVNYLTSAGLDASCINPGSPTSAYDTTTFTAVYTCANGTSLTINMDYQYTPSGGSPILANKIILTYPYTWTINGLIKPLAWMGFSLSLPPTITTAAIM
jgi:Flp pilus assembly protein TadG